MKKLLLALLIIPLVSYAQVGIGTTSPNASAALDITDTTKGILIPRMTQLERDAINLPANGLLIYQTNGVDGFYYYNSSAWTSLNQGGSSWTTTGNAGTNITVNKVGTTDVQDFIFKTNNTEAIRVLSNGNVGIGTVNPTTKLHIVGANSLKINDGNQGANKVLTSDANGVASWQNNTFGTENDWLWYSGTTNDDPIYHIGSVFIGSGATTTSYNLHVWNGNTTGSRFDTGSVEYIIDNINEIQLSDFVTPVTTGTQNLGVSARRWSAVYAKAGVINTSDRRLKENIKPMSLGLKEVLKLRPVSFNWKEEFADDYKIPDSKKDVKLGFIAQEVQKVMPDAIVDKEWYLDGNHLEKGLEQIKTARLGISYSEMIPVVVKAIQEQQQDINAIEQTNKKLKEILKKLEKE